MEATALASIAASTTFAPFQNPNHGVGRRIFRPFSSPASCNSTIARHRGCLSAFGQSPLLSFCAPRRHDRARARTSRTHIFLPHLVASMVRFPLSVPPSSSLSSVFNTILDPPCISLRQEDVDETYVMVKPDGVQRGLVGEIISRFEKKGFLLKGLKLFQCPKELAEIRLLEMLIVNMNVIKRLAQIPDSCYFSSFFLVFTVDFTRKSTSLALQDVYDDARKGGPLGARGSTRVAIQCR
ncbi:hypothetical protein KSP39_PZI023818 [Platanthera zijinensis]|uniref:nucleoside-diphosphate kinase n=1 Tax=Platanthera zijinensis TaxID=2320716 RepID=A0AAP0FTR7_9ASPA